MTHFLFASSLRTLLQVLCASSQCLSIALRTTFRLQICEFQGADDSRQRTTFCACDLRDGLWELDGSFQLRTFGKPEGGIRTAAHHETFGDSRTRDPATKKLRHNLHIDPSNLLGASRCERRELQTATLFSPLTSTSSCPERNVPAHHKHVCCPVLQQILVRLCLRMHKLHLISAMQLHMNMRRIPSRWMHTMPSKHL